MGTRANGAAAHCGLLAALLQGAFACEGSVHGPPAAGQTGSPIAPDEDGDVPFIPPEDGPPDNDSFQEVPLQPIEDPPLTASFGVWLYVATPRGLFGVDTSAAAPVAPVPLLTDAAPRGVWVEGTALSVVADVVSADAETPEGMTEARLLRFDLAGEPARPALLSSVRVPGAFFMAREGGDRLVTLSAETEPWPCSALRHQRGTRRTGQLVVRDFRLEDDAWTLRDEVAVEADGFVETDSGFVLVWEDLPRRHPRIRRDHGRGLQSRIESRAVPPDPDRGRAIHGAPREERALAAPEPRRRGRRGAAPRHRAGRSDVRRCRARRHHRALRAARG